MRRSFIWILLILLIILLRPGGIWRESKQAWAQRERISRVLFFVFGIYFLYGLYSLYTQGWFTWLTGP